MECFNCKSFYNNTQNTPHLLTDCGHSICFHCLKLNYINQVVICPECKVSNRKENITLFPKNLALLYIKPPSANDKSLRASLQPATSVLDSQDLKGICLKHNKKLEAFCENDRQLLCVVCMIHEGYKNKDISTIPEAAEKERSLISKAWQLAQIAENRCKLVQSSIMEGYKRLSSAADRAAQEVTVFFNEIRDVIAGREFNLKREIAEKQRREEDVIKLKQESVTELMNNITSFYYDHKQTLKQDDIALLSGSAQRIELIKQMTEETGDFEFQVSFKELDRLKELNSIWNILSPLDERQSNGEQHRMRIAKTLSGSSITNKSNDKNQSSVMRTHSKNKATKQSTVASSLRGTWGDKRADKTVKQRIPSGLASPVVQVKDSERMKRNTERQEKLFEKIAELDCDYKGETTSLAQIPYDSQDMKPNYAEKNLNNQLAFNDSPFQAPSKSVSASVITINLNENDDYPKENIQPTYNQAHPNFSDLMQRENWTIHTERINTPHYELYGRGLDGRPNESKSEIKRVETSHCSSFHTNGELLDLLNPGRDYDFSRKFDLKSVGGKAKGQYMQSQTYRGNMQNKSRANLSKESFLDYNKENLKFMNQQNVSMSSRDFPKKNTSILPKDILDTHPSFDNMMHERKHSEWNDTMNWSAICQNINSYIYIMDGNGHNLHARVERLDMQKGYWEYGGAIPGNRSKFTAVVLPHSGNILMMGGKEKGARTASCEEYILDEKVFRQSQIKLKCEKSGFGALAFGDEIFICGGNNGKDILRSFESYNLTTNTWKVLAPLKQVREELGLVIGPDQKIYAVGGIGGPNMLPLNTVERYDPEKKEWEYVAPLNVARRALSVVSLPDGIYAIGGFDGHNYLNTVEKYDENINEWILVGSMNFARCRAAAVTSSDFRNIYIFGGENYEALNSVERYSVINNRWELVESMRTARSMHSAVIVSK